ncbi:hypothetical protein DEU56DRAFT_827490 [Suillus clintonianus]|uniref:uncharacterized protein n=1 Tax=Suillus clintonianus TaxID=1904413 RepID=UPI001B85E4E4|nr:uncharacterized protein DEU56DRAFT_827490 [Suillus clintonianus]KAG2124372.1 hypothetical protein DEU56DRAFT_827490 [Suillus clintonianus]
MFGESDSESPRVPSPWDTLTSVPPTPTHNEILRRGIPQLVPENEEGNVEYKLHLLSPSPSRFTRLVTQLKWRLLEGGGQAYYELGVADSGVLIGLGRREMEETLGTLEEMAGEIGASVIVVKEIEVPAEVSGVVEDWGGDGKRRRRRRLMNEDSETTTTTETELETTDADDDLPTRSSQVEVFCMDDDEGDLSSDGAAFTLDLEISAVYKPRPFRRRVASTVQGISDRRKGKGKKPRHLLAHTRAQSNTHSEHHTHHSHHLNVHNRTDFAHSIEPKSHSMSNNKQSKRRAARDKRREIKRDPLVMHVPTINAEEMGELVSGLESFHVTLEPEDLRAAPAPPEVEISVHHDAHLEDPRIFEVCSGSPSSIFAETYCQPQPLANELVSSTDITPPMLKSPSAEIETTMLEPRLIVEALVVRKMSLEEAFLDFGGFSVC